MEIEKGIAKAAKAHQRYRTADGTIVPGVTTVLGVIAKPQLVKWANNLGLQGIDSTAYVDETAKVGTLAHQMIQEHLDGPKWDREAYTASQIDLAENAVLSFYEWERQTGAKMETLLIEKQLVSETLKYGGTIDWYGRIDGKLWLVDIKTCKTLYSEHEYQVAAYRHLLAENGLKVDGVRLLRVGRTNDEGFDDRILGSTMLSAGLKTFVAALDLYKANQAYERLRRADMKPNDKEEAA